MAEDRRATQERLRSVTRDLEDDESAVRFLIATGLGKRRRKWRRYYAVDEGIWCDDLERATLFRHVEQAGAVCRCLEPGGLIAKVTIAPGYIKFLRYLHPDDAD